ncbi:SDR family NAD(P)-dependent oxidoreductase [Lawsonibacter celer]|uniref:SDR family NAD(P)-dependent oxidoreductase n=1 Tax=Lawsonibacter celer TaxID=2986526 RepID=UPI0016466EE3|nr:SDR family NAD(P)-dependent oxidoreductase [Lawsonibacter celer]
MKIAIVTGASSGLGRAFVRQLDREGGLDEIWGVARRAGRMEELAAELNTPMRALALDLVKPESIEALKDRMEEEQPDVRVLINAAGFGKFGTYADMTLPETSDMIDLNCKAAANLTAAVIPHMGRGGRVLEICSSASFQPLPGFNVYAATKAFLLHYSRALRWEVAPRGICVTAVCPGWIKTEFMKVARDTANGRTVRHYPFALRPETVASRALRDNRLGMAVTTCSLPSLVQRTASKFLPHCFIMACWEGLRRI